MLKAFLIFALILLIRFFLLAFKLWLNIRIKKISSLFLIVRFEINVIFFDLSVFDIDETLLILFFSFATFEKVIMWNVK